MACFDQSMTNTDTRNIPDTITQIQRLADLGCEIIRLAVPDVELRTLQRIVPNRRCRLWRIHLIINWL